MIAAHSRQPLRRSADHVWPLRCADGRTWAQRKADEAERIARRAAKLPQPPEGPGDGQ